MPPVSPAPLVRPRLSWAAGLALGALLVGGAAVRVQGLRDPIVAFHPLRHYRSALIARACYYEATPSTPAWALAIARANRDIQQAGEPPVMEWMACTAYRVLGREELAVPRMLSGLWWLAGGIATYLLGRRAISVPGGLLAATLYLFLPYSIVATRTFQPDPLMTACTAWALLALVRWSDRPDRRRLVIAAGLAGAALFVKPMSVFIVIPAMAVAARSGPGSRSDSRSRDTILLVVLSLIPPGLFYGSSLLFGTLAQDQMQTRFVPSLLITAFFWKGLARQIHVVFGWVAAIAAVIGTVVASDRLLRRLLAAIWLGYAAFVVVFTYHAPTHDYYHLPFVPIVALIGPALRCA
jgi:4-amino-4-deoxy-L-arabinose transferase-like glycosyltransferase